MAYPTALARTKNWGTEILTDTDLEGQLDLIITFINAALNSSTGHKHDATTSEGPKILTANIDDSAGTQGDVYFSSGTAISRLATGTVGQVLSAGGAGADPTWEDAPAADQSTDGSQIQIQYTSTSAVDTTTNSIPNDDTIPVPASEGKAAITDTITMGSTTNALRIQSIAKVAHSAAGLVNSYITWNHSGISETVLDVANCGETGVRTRTMPIDYTFVPGTTNEITIKTYFGSDSGTATLNGKSGGRLFGGKMYSTQTLTEIKAS